MKTYLRSLSILVLCLAAFAAGRWSQPSESPLPPTVAARSLKPSPTLAPPPRALPPVTWKSLEHGEYPRFLANLRAFGCPEDVIRDLVVAEVFCRAAGQSTDGGGPWNALLSLWQDHALARAVVAEGNQILGRRVLALEGTAIDDPASVAAEVEVDYVARMNALWTALKGAEPSAPVQAASERLEADRRAALLRVFTPAQLEQYEFERSGELADMKRDFSRLEPTDEEAVLLARMHRAGEGPLASDLQNLTAMLGAERFAAYQDILRGTERELP